MKASSHYIYIIDDNRVSLKILQKRIKELTHYKVRTFVTAEDCLRILRYRTPDLVLADLNLDSEAPDHMNGDKFLRVVKKFYPKLPVIMFSSSDSIKLISKLICDGAKSFIPRDGNFIREISKVTMEEIRKQKEHLRKIHQYKDILLAAGLLIIFVAVDFLVWRRSFPWLSVIALLITTSWIAQRRAHESYDQTDTNL